MWKTLGENRQDSGKRWKKYKDARKTSWEHPIPLVFEDLGAMIRCGRTHGQITSSLGAPYGVVWKWVPPNSWPFWGNLVIFIGKNWIYKVDMSCDTLKFGDFLITWHIDITLHKWDVYQVCMFPTDSSTSPGLVLERNVQECVKRSPGIWRNPKTPWHLGWTRLGRHRFDEHLEIMVESGW